MCQCELIRTRTGLGVSFLISAITTRAVDGRVLLSNTVTSASFTTTTVLVAVHISMSDDARNRNTPSPIDSRTTDRWGVAWARLARLTKTVRARTAIGVALRCIAFRWWE